MTTLLNAVGQCETIAKVIAAHPKIFKGRYPERTSPIPIGWCDLIDHFFSILERRCSEEELNHIKFYELGNQHGALELDFEFQCPLPAQHEFEISALIYGLRNRSAVTCVKCGKIVEEFPETGEEALCNKHLRVKQLRSKHRVNG